MLEIARNLGFDPVGIAPIARPEHWEAYRDWLENGRHGTMSYLEKHLDLKKSPENLLPGAKSAIVVGLNYYQASGEPKIARYALGRDYHRVLRGKLRKLVAHVEQRFQPVSGISNLANDSKSPTPEPFPQKSDTREEGPHFRICVDSAPLMERDLAQAAGLGWFGKNTMIINSQRGSWFVLGVVLTTLEIEPTGPAVGGCGTCRACIDACPTGAILHENGRWQVNAPSCISYLTIEHKGPFNETQSKQVSDWTFGCDVCQEVCPFNHPRENRPLRAQTTQEADFTARTLPRLQELAQMSQAEWSQATLGSSIRRTGYDGLKRNAQANLKNALNQTE